jgi:hypothetical protein
LIQRRSIAQPAVELPLRRDLVLRKAEQGSEEVVVGRAQAVTTLVAEPLEQQLGASIQRRNPLQSGTTRREAPPARACYDGDVQGREHEAAEGAPGEHAGSALLSGRCAYSPKLPWYGTLTAIRGEP